MALKWVTISSYPFIPQVISSAVDQGRKRGGQNEHLNLDKKLDYEKVFHAHFPKVQ